jgi:hypothetical protein
MSNGPGAEAFNERVQRAEHFLIYFANGDRTYHQHKENMAYAGTAVLITAFGSALLSKNWPPVWTIYPSLTFALPILALVFAWTFFLAFVRFQLENRRWVAIRLAATEDILTSWSCQYPTTEELEPVTLTEQGSQDSLLRSVTWPSGSMPIKLDLIPQRFPRAFANAIAAKAAGGNPAVIHERILLLFTWLLFGALLTKTVVVLHAALYSGLTRP